ncbi:interferon-inducible GTPase-domain-containing protein [Pisolithus orientalis]|uniref:interferon-inducible GTPase-domain-containing protein n=1 Tax=Pisolithus orientalis TaxID=936130 RepID=UPI002224430F|nr:interferon-inducible GTPase-domain-containing protein [Pisolithus orientalis]KAI5994074.1 interferon-inducible GTPase-domain-containing protein [Pisolithus orientalis]
MGQVLVVGIGVAGCALLQLAWHIWKRLVSVSTRPVRDNPRLRAMAESESGEEYVRGIAGLAAQNASEAARVAEEAQRQSEQAIRDKVRALHREVELTREVGRAKRRQRTLEAEGDPLLGLFWRGGKGPSVERLDEVRRETERIQEKAKKARQNSMEIVERVKVTQAVMEKTAREAEESTRTAKEVQADAEECLKRGIRPVVIPTLEEISAAKKRVQYEQGRFHFAVAGVAGSGKSSFVNAIRGVDAQHQDAAESGIVETTVTIGRYPDPNPDLPFVWYDIPGAGTLQQPDWLYFNTQGLFVFDCVVVLFDNRFTETDIAILTNCRRFQIPTYIVRSKADIHIRNIMHKDGYDSDRDDRAVRESLFPDARRRFITDTRASVKKNLKEGGLPDQRVYMISNSTLLSIVRDRSLWAPHKIIDELELIKDILDEVCSHRCADRANDDDCLV